MANRARVDRSQGRPEPIRALNRVIEQDMGEPMVSIAGRHPRLVVGKKSTVPWVRERVADMLIQAVEALPADVCLHVTEAWRPLERQRLIYEFFWESSIRAYPELGYASRRRLVNRWVAPVDQKAPPGHCTGGAVDVHLHGVDGSALDVTSPFTRFEGAATYVLGLTPTAEHHRRLLLAAMLGAGFTNCRDEYWHYSFGDAAWAVRKGLDTCRYGAVSLDLDLYVEPQRIWLQELATREDPFAHRKV